MTITLSDAEQKRIFANNLRDALNRSGKQQIEVARAIGVSQQTFNTWCRGIALPRMGKLEKLANYFGIRKSALIDAPSVHPVKTPTLKRVQAGRSMYVVQGDTTQLVRAATIIRSKDQILLVQKYGRLSAENKAKVQEYIDFLIEKG